VIHNTRGTYRRFSSNKTEANIVQWDYGSWPDGLPKKDGANALSGARSFDTATTRLSKASRTKNLIIEYYASLCPKNSGFDFYKAMLWILSKHPLWGGERGKLDR